MSTSRKPSKPLTIVTLLLFAGIAMFVLTAPSIAPEPPPTAAPPVETTTQPPTTLPPTTVPPTTAPPAAVAPATVPPTTTPPAPPTTAPPAQTIEYEPGSIENMICAAFGDQCSKALSVVHCESRFNPGTVGAAGDRGLFQIHPVHIPYLSDRGMSWEAMFDPASNIAYAHDLYSRSGWGPWTCA